MIPSPDPPTQSPDGHRGQVLLADHGERSRCDPFRAGRTGQNPGNMARDTEIALALSACPPAVAKAAGVYVLTRSSYEEARDSQNGFTAIVQHSAPTGTELQCMDAEGSRTILQRYLRAESGLMSAMALYAPTAETSLIAEEGRNKPLIGAELGL